MVSTQNIKCYWSVYKICLLSEKITSSFSLTMKIHDIQKLYRKLGSLKIPKIIFDSTIWCWSSKIIEIPTYPILEVLMGALGAGRSIILWWWFLFQYGSITPKAKLIPVMKNQEHSTYMKWFSVRPIYFHLQCIIFYHMGSWNIKDWTYYMTATTSSWHFHCMFTVAS